MLFAIYKSIGHFDEHLLPSERRFFPANPKERTMGKFLSLVPTVYEILRDARDRHELQETFARFWKECCGYLNRCGYSNTGFMLEGELFHRQSFNFWRKEFQDTQDGLDTMFRWFKSCFGIEGNDEYCIVNLHTEVTYDWRKMRACHAGLQLPPPQITGGEEIPGSLDWRPETVRLLHEARERIGYAEPVDEEGAEKVLEDIRRKNVERGFCNV